MVGFRGHHFPMRFPGQVFAQDDYFKLVFSHSVAGSDGLLSLGNSQ